MWYLWRSLRAPGLVLNALYIFQFAGTMLWISTYCHPVSLPFADAVTEAQR